MVERERNGEAPPEHNEMKHDETNPKTSEAKLTNIWESQQAHAQRTGHDSQNEYLERFNIIDNATCLGWGKKRKRCITF
jgi:hypothetical protein